MHLTYFQFSRRYELLAKMAVLQTNLNIIDSSHSTFTFSIKHATENKNSGGATDGNHRWNQLKNATPPSSIYAPSTPPNSKLRLF
jgi:hypothetical protein